MANVYVYSGAAGAGTGADWTNAYTTLAAAASAKAAGDDFWIASDHAESAASAKTITFPGTSASPNRCISVSRAGSTPPVAADILAGAAITTTGANNITINGNVYVYGIAFTASDGVAAGNIVIATTTAVVQQFDTCSFAIGGTGSGLLNLCTGYLGAITFTNCTCSFAAAGQGFALTSGTFIWANKPGSVALLGTAPTTLVRSNITNGTGFFVLDGLDLSAMGSGKTIIGAHLWQFSIVNCKLGASVTVASTPTANSAKGVDVIGSSSGSNVRRDERYRYQGTLTTETTIIRTSGASDGTTAFSWKIVTTANSKRTFPFESIEGAIWNDTTGSSKTLTVHCVTDNVTLQDADIWIEVEYLGDASYPVTTLITDANATVLTTAANQSTSTETWTTTGLVTPLKQKLDVTFTPQMKGPIRWKVKVAKASATVYVCPKAELS